MWLLPFFISLRKINEKNIQLQLHLHFTERPSRTGRFSSRILEKENQWSHVLATGCLLPRTAGNQFCAINNCRLGLFFGRTVSLQVVPAQHRSPLRETRAPCSIVSCSFIYVNRCRPLTSYPAPRRYWKTSWGLVARPVIVSNTRSPLGAQFPTNIFVVVAIGREMRLFIHVLNVN